MIQLVILDDMLSLSLDLPIGRGEFTGGDPMGGVDGLRGAVGTWKRAKANMQCETKSLRGNASRLARWEYRKTSSGTTDYFRGFDIDYLMEEKACALFGWEVLGTPKQAHVRSLFV